MQLKEILIKKYGDLSKAARELGFNQGDLNKLVNRNIHPRIDTIQRLSVNGITCTVNNGKIVWNMENK